MLKEAAKMLGVSKPCGQRLADAQISSADRDPDTQTDIETLSARLRAGIEVKDRSYRLTTYKQVFLGTEAVAFMLRQGIVTRYCAWRF
jgi:hypothetical protein